MSIKNKIAFILFFSILGALLFFLPLTYECGLLRTHPRINYIDLNTFKEGYYAPIVSLFLPVIVLLESLVYTDSERSRNVMASLFVVQSFIAGYGAIPLALSSTLFCSPTFWGNFIPWLCIAYALINLLMVHPRFILTKKLFPGQKKHY